MHVHPKKTILNPAKNSDSKKYLPPCKSCRIISDEYCDHHKVQGKSQLVLFVIFYGMKACTVPLTVFLHIGQSTIAGAQETQQTRWPQGRKIIPTTDEKQILQVN